MRITFSTPVTPTRDRLTWVEGRRAWTSAPVVSRRSVMRGPRYLAPSNPGFLRRTKAKVPRYTRRGSTPLGNPPNIGSALRGICREPHNDGDGGWERRRLFPTTQRRTKERG